MNTLHDWVPSTHGHGETMCSRCLITNREAAVLGELNSCPRPPEPAPVSDDTPLDALALAVCRVFTHTPAATLSDFHPDYLGLGRQAATDVLELLTQHDATPFRRGVRAALQAAVDDLHQLVLRRQRAEANETHTQLIVGIARRLAALPMPPSEEEAAQTMPTEVLRGRVAQLLLPDMPWDDITGVMPDGRTILVEGVDDSTLSTMQAMWDRTADIVALVRYA